jgi:hypothetical protein
MINRIYHTSHLFHNAALYEGESKSKGKRNLAALMEAAGSVRTTVPTYQTT